MSFYHLNPEVEAPAYTNAEGIKKALLGFDFTDVADESLDILAEQASRMIDDYTNSIFFQTQVVQEKHQIVQDAMLRFVVRTNFRPVVSVDDCFIEVMPNEQMAVPLQYIDLHHQQGILYVYTTGSSTYGKYLDMRRYGAPVGTIVVSYTTGPDRVPSPIVRATQLIVRNLLSPGALLSGVAEDKNTNTGPLKRVASKSYSEEYSTTSGVKSDMKMSIKPEDDFLFTSDIKAILRPYCRRGVL